MKTQSKTKSINRPELKFENKNFIYVYPSNFDKYIYQVYGQEFDLLGYNDWEMEHLYWKEVKKGKLSELEKEELENFKKTGVCNYITDVLLTDLCNRGLLQEGDYLFSTF